MVLFHTIYLLPPNRVFIVEITVGRRKQYFWMQRVLWISTQEIFVARDVALERHKLQYHYQSDKKTFFFLQKQKKSEKQKSNHQQFIRSWNWTTIHLNLCLIIIIIIIINYYYYYYSLIEPYWTRLNLFDGLQWTTVKWTLDNMVEQLIIMIY